MGLASGTWPHEETDPQRGALLAAADRLLAGEPRHSSGNLSVVQLAIEAQLKYWVIAQKHTDLRDHFQQLAARAKEATRRTSDAEEESDTLAEKHAELQRHCRVLEERLALYATALNELALENEALREQATERRATVTPLTPRDRTSQQSHC
jgi:hypothetical protein